MNGAESDALADGPGLGPMQLLRAPSLAEVGAQPVINWSIPLGIAHNTTCL